jgi:hypothetical protein
VDLEADDLLRLEELALLEIADDLGVVRLGLCDLRQLFLCDIPDRVGLVAGLAFILAKVP